MMREEKKVREMCEQENKCLKIMSWSLFGHFIKGFYYVHSCNTHHSLQLTFHKSHLI